ncbi:hypothetical protein HZA99_03515 [Candidatus Woesearchaeota archaeon]|nr:hypothetical protein [Candidatus Woesearchaeota archaeon]
MQQNKYLQQMALFMIFLVLSIPFISAQAFASTTVTINSYSGKDGVTGVVSTYSDALTVEAEVTPDNTTDTFANFSTNNVYVDVFGKKEAMDNCEKGASSYTCSYTSATTDRTAGEKTLAVNVYSDTSVVAATADATVLIDGNKPTFSSFTYPSTWTDAVNVSYKLSDTACTSCSGCSGLDRIEFFVNGTLKENTTLATGSEDCDYQGTLETSVSDLGVAEGSQQLCAYIYDGVQNNQKKCVSIVVDSTAPSISSSSFVVKDDNGNAIEHLSGVAIHATVSVNITEKGSGLVVDTVYGNFSSLNPNVGSAYDEMPGDCTEYENGLFVCQWDLYIDLGAETTATAKIFAEDEAGNSQVLTKTLSFVADTTAPVLVGLTSAFNGYLNAKNNTLTLEIQEEGSGFDDKNVYLNLGQILLGNRQADSCAQSGTLWYCYWSPFVIPSSVPHGEAVKISPATITDDAGNDYDKTASISDVTFVYDEEAPVFLNITLQDLSLESDALVEGDVVAITAFVTDDVSGIDAANVYADYGAFDSANDYTAAQSCTEVDTDLWECYWEYTGALTSGDEISLNIRAMDNAGNVKDSDDDHVVGSAHVVGLVSGTADYWAEDAAVDQVPELNPNFLYFTTTGTLVRLDTALVSKSGSVPYVHNYNVDSCQAAYYAADNLTAKISWVDATVVSQYYYDATDKTSKYALVNIPPLFYGKANATVPEGSSIDLVCTGSVTESRSVYGDIYSPPEQVNISVTVSLMSGLFTEPSLASVDKIQTMTDVIKTLDDITKFLGAWTEWGTKICSPMNGIIVVANNLVTILKGVNALVGEEGIGAVSGAVSVTNTLNDVWNGYYSKDDIAQGEADKRIQTDAQTGERTYGSNPDQLFSNKHKLLSLGFACDTVLCESCSENWNKVLGLKGGPGGYVGGEYVPNWIGQDFTIPLNPRENIIVALICWPPCIPGIYGQLNAYKEILIAYNTCLNIAVTKGEDVIECDQFLSAQICQNIVNAFFWHWFWGLKNFFISKAVGFVLEKVRSDLLKCPEFKDNPKEPVGICSTWRAIMALTTITVTVVDTYNTLKGIFDMDFNMTGNQTPEQQQDTLQTDVETDIGDQLGTTPSYG